MSVYADYQREIEEYQARIAELERQLAGVREYAGQARIRENKAEDTRVHLSFELTKARAQIAAKDAALRFYANRQHYIYDGSDDATNELLEDGGAIAAAALSQPAPAQGDMMLLPREPDDAMIEAGQDAVEDKQNWGGNIYAADIYAAMVVAYEPTQENKP